jgi:aminopeptidase
MDERMSDLRLTKTAGIVLQYSTAIKAGDWVLIKANMAARPLVEEVCRQIWSMGARISLQWESDALTEIFINTAKGEVLSWLSPADQLLFEQVNIILYLDASDNPRGLSGIKPDRMGLFQTPTGRLRQIRNQRVQSDDLRWLYTQYPTQAYAQEAGMELSAYQDFAYRAIFAEQPDPVATWQALQQRQQRWVNWLADRHEVSLRGEHIDLQLSISGRKFINGSGQNNLPDGELFTGPVESSANGWVRFSYPAIYHGRSVEGIELRFENGEVTDAHAQRDDAYLQAMLDIDAGARYLGEFAIGTNYAIRDFSRNILYDEKIGGTIHLALGNGYPETGSVNRSLIHWDLICDMRQQAEIIVDGELLFRDGEFQI